MTRREILLQAGGAAAASAIGPARAAGWPTQPVRMIVTQAAGGTPDIICRMLSDRLSQALGQAFVVENHPGAGNVIGTQIAARATPDGSTFLWATAASLTTNVFTIKNLPYDPRKDFVNVARVAKGPFLVMANPALAANSLPEVIAMAKAKPGQLTIANDGPRNFSGLIAAWLNRKAGVDIRPVPYPNMPQGVQDTVSGRVDLCIIAIPSAVPMIRGGMLKPIAISSAQRAPGFEKVAPVAETIPGFDFYGWMGVCAPARTPQPIIDELNARMGVILDDRAFAKGLEDIGFYSFGAHKQAVAEKAVSDELALWQALVTEIGIQPE
jgi:tripartite-type tricarboxylate transporter receptor subunit TctC